MKAPAVSLRAKVFLVLGITLVLMAAGVMLVARHDVLETAAQGESRALANTVRLLLRDSDARWATYLNEKIRTVRGERERLVELGDMVESVLTVHARQAARGEVTPEGARRAALDWLASQPGSGRRATVLTDEWLELSPPEGQLARDFSRYRDYRERPLPATLGPELQRDGHASALFRPLNGSASLHYGHFRHFAPWNWTLVIYGDAADIRQTLESRRLAVERDMRETIDGLQLGQSGFAFIASEAGRLIAPPPALFSGLLSWQDADFGASLGDLLRRIPETGETVPMTFHGGQQHGVWYLTAAHFRPLQWTIVAAVPEKDLTAPADGLLRRLLMVFLATGTLALLLAWFLSARLTRPLRRLTGLAGELAAHDFGQPQNALPPLAGLPLARRDEVGQLARAFRHMGEQLQGNVSRRLHEAAQRERMESELDVARDIQAGLLPHAPPSLAAGYELHAIMQAARQVGGDFYDHFSLPDGRLCVVVGDVSDKGVPAALFMAVTRTQLRAAAQGSVNLDELVKRLNDSLAEHNPRLMFVTLIVLALDMHTGHLQWVNAGHPAPLAMRADGRIRSLEGRSGPACGVLSGNEYRPFHNQLQAGETLLLFTDGVTEAMSSSGELFGDERLQALLSRQGLCSARQQAQGLLAGIMGWSTGRDLADDITIVTLRRTP